MASLRFSPSLLGGSQTAARSDPRSWRLAGGPGAASGAAAAFLGGFLAFPLAGDASGTGTIAGTRLCVVIFRGLRIARFDVFFDSSGSRRDLTLLDHVAHLGLDDSREMLAVLGHAALPQSRYMYLACIVLYFNMCAEIQSRYM